MKKQLNTAIAALFLATASMTAMALEEVSQSYFGISYGNASADSGITDLTGTASLDEDHKVGKLFAGFNIDKNFAIEGYYSNLGKLSLSVNNGDTFVDNGVAKTANETVTATTTTKNYGLAGVYKFDKINEITPFVKLGLNKWKTTTDDSTTNETVVIKGTDSFYGAGLSYPLADTVNIRAEFEQFEIENADVNYVSVGISKNF